MDNKEFEYRLYFDGENWIMEQYNKISGELVFATIGTSEMDCIKQMFNQEEKEITEHLFKFHWEDGKIEESYGTSVSNAFNKLGYGAGALAVLDYYEEIK